MLSRKAESATAVHFKKGAMNIIEQESDVARPWKQENGIRECIEKYSTIIGMLERFDEVLCRRAGGQPLVSLANVFVVLISCLQPRQLSISSSDVTSPRRLSITTGVVSVCLEQRGDCERCML